jgi:hypothetical protein
VPRKITPNPSEAERRAIEAALGVSADDSVPPAYRSPWRLAVLDEPGELTEDPTEPRRDRPQVQRIPGDDD